MFRQNVSVVAIIAVSLLICGQLSAQTEKSKKRNLVMIATAYATYGKQRAGTITREGTAAADPAVLPLGTRVRVHGNRGYIGELVITDTGRRVKGRRLDVYFNSRAQAKRFGRQRVTIEVLEWGSGPASARQEVTEGIKPPRLP